MKKKQQKKEPLSKQIVLRVTDRQLGRLQRTAKAKKISVAAVVRGCL